MSAAETPQPTPVADPSEAHAFGARLPDGRLPESLLTELEALAVAAATAAGALVHDQRPSIVRAAATKSSPTDVVTEMDRRAEDLIRSLLLTARPDDAVLGEERSDHAGTSGITWVVDPIDGTVNYLYDVPAYGVSVAAAIGDPRVPGSWQVVAGAVADPTHGEVFHARLGAGAFVEPVGQPDAARGLTVGSGDTLATALVGTGFGYTVDRRRAQAEVVMHLLPQIRDIRRIGSAALDLCWVGEGTLDAFYEFGLNPWDLAAGWLVVTEAGGLVTGPDGAGAAGLEPGALTVAANPAIHEQLLDRLTDAVRGRSL